MKASEERATKLHSEVIRMLGYCENCGTSQSLTPAHIIKRRIKSVKTDTRNAMCLCLPCHEFYERHADAFAGFVANTWAAQYFSAVKARSQQVIKVDWDERIRFLEQIKAGLISIEDAREMEHEL